MKDKLRDSQMNKNQENVPLAHLPYKKHQRKTERLKWKDLDSTLKSYKKIKNTSKGNYIGKFKKMYKCIVTLFSLIQLKGNCIIQ